MVFHVFQNSALALGWSYRDQRTLKSHPPVNQVRYCDICYLFVSLFWVGELLFISLVPFFATSLSLSLFSVSLSICLSGFSLRDMLYPSCARMAVIVYLHCRPSFQRRAGGA